MATAPATDTDGAVAGGEVDRRDRRRSAALSRPSLRAIGARRRVSPYDRAVPLKGDYEPSRWNWVADQVAAYERSGGREANTLRDTGLPIIVVTTLGHRTGKVRKFALMRVEHDGEYALVASKGGAPEHPGWYHNLVAHPTDVAIQDGPEPFDAQVRQVTGDERARWWERAVAAYPPYADYQERTQREIPVLVARRAGT